MYPLVVLCFGFILPTHPHMPIPPATISWPTRSTRSGGCTAAVAPKSVRLLFSDDCGEDLFGVTPPGTPTRLAREQGRRDLAVPEPK